MTSSIRPADRRPRLVLAVAACLVAALVASPAASAAWSPESSGTTDALRGVSCPTESTCYAVGDNGRIVATSNGGASWTAQSSGTTLGLRGITCPATRQCLAVGAHSGSTSSNRVRVTSDGGASWSSQSASTTANLNGISCESTSFCLFVGDGGRIGTISSGSSFWTDTSVATEDLFGASCFTGPTCWAVGANGRIVRRMLGSNSQQPSGTTDTLYGVSCPTATTCWAVGASGRIVATADAGMTWAPQASGTTDTLRGVSCPTALTCWAVGDNGRIVYTTNGGLDWATDVSGVTGNLYGVSCAGAFSCRAVGAGGSVLRYVPSLDYPSHDCDAGTAVLDGFVGDAYYKLRTAQNPADPTTTWVCVAVDAEGEHRGGKVLVSQDAAHAAAADDDAAACDADPANRIFEEDGEVGPIPFELEVNEASGEVWVCVSANGSTLAKRIVIATGSLPAVTFLADAASPYPYTEAPSLGSASAACQAAPSSRERLLNAQVGASHVWLYTWSESATRAHVCTRVDDAGGRLTLDGNGSQTIATVDSEIDFSPCDSNVLTLSTPPISSKVHVGAPAWACLRAGSTYRRVKLDAGGDQGIASFTPDS